MRQLYWFQTDLRLQDNPGLSAHLDANQLLLVYLWPKNRPWCNVTGIGQQRERFLLESLRELHQQLQQRGQHLLILQGSPELVIPDLVRDYRIEHVATSRTPGFYERKSLDNLRARLSIPLTVHSDNSLFRESALPFALPDLPGHFAEFRRQVAPIAPAKPVPAADALPPSPVQYAAVPPIETHAPHTALPVRGGSSNGQRRLRQFIFEQQDIVDYKATRNCLDGLDGSSTLSPWLADGSLSVREVAQGISRFEQEHLRNASTEHLFMELLWREYFHWRAYQDDVNLFRLRAGKQQKRLSHCTFEPRSFARWCQGDTEYPLVNALMRQLVATGWMSNRGRQIAASCLINELALDWRYGAAFFEKHLLDYDVASNYGNWQYIAGVGADPRGGRHFNLEKQAREHDPDGLFTQKWGGRRPPQPEFVVDAADWPIQGN
jgi:deoxyribodipyrimidine photo-lyase